MKKLFGKLITVMLLVVPFIINGCGFKTESQNIGSEIRVLIPNLMNEQPVLEVVTLKGVDDLSGVSGRHAVFYYAPKIENQNVVGAKPRAKFIKGHDGVFVPVDSQSAQMAAIYFHIQSLSELSSSVGIGEFVKPMKVALSTRIQKGTDWIHNSAFYDQKADAMIFVDFTSQVLPLTINPGVIAHEYFHSIFSKILINPLLRTGFLSEEFQAPAEPRATDRELKIEKNNIKLNALKKFLTEYLYLKALNEGLADYWGWLYAQDQHFVQRSLPEHGHRNIKDTASVKLSNLDYSPVVTDIIRKYNSYSPEAVRSMQEDISAFSYSLGTQYARFFRHLSNGRDLNHAKTILELIKSLQISFASNNSDLKVLFPGNVIERYRNSNPELAAKNCQKFAEVITSLECAP